MAKPDIKTVVQGLTDRAEDLARTLLPNGRRHGHEWRCGSLAGEAGQSLSVNIGPSRPGVWQDFSSVEDKGDAFDLVAKCLFNGDKKQAMAWSISWLGLDDMSPERFKQNRRQAKQRSAERAKLDRKEEAKTRANAKKLWLDASPDILGSPVDLYLKGRGIDISKLEYVPRSIRFASSLREPSNGVCYPAMVTGFNGVDGNFAAVHRTFLHIHPGGHLTKAAVPCPKMVLGRFKGGCIRLWRGEDVNPETGEVKRVASWGKIKGSARLTIVEGIEDGLTVALAAPGRRVAVSVTLGHLAGMLLPKCFTEITIVGDNDDPDSQAATALADAIAGFQRQGRKVFLSRAPEGFKDLNDLLNGNHVHGG